MSSIDFEVDLSHEEREIQSTVHRFAEEVLRPAGQELDGLSDPQAVIDKNSLLWNTFEEYDALGIDGLNFADPDSSPATIARIQSIILEELAWGDAGLALSIATRGMMGMYAELSGNADLIERFGAQGKNEIGCWAITEPDHGSDTLAMSEPHFNDASIKANCIAVKDGDDYIIKGQKSSWVSNGPIATVAALFCTIAGDKGFEGGGVAIVPLDLAGVSKGKPLNKLGQRALPQGEIFFDDVRIPAGYMLADQESYKDTLNMQLTLANSFMGVSFSGVARSAYDLAVQYASERIQGGKPINQHQSVKLRLFDMFRKVETASSFARKTHIYIMELQKRLSFTTQSPPKLIVRGWHLMSPVKQYKYLGVMDSVRNIPSKKSCAMPVHQ